MSKFTYQITEEDCQVKLRDLLKRRMGFSTRLLRKLKDHNGIRCEGRIVKLNERLEPGACVMIELPEETSYFEPEDIPIQVIYEDDDLLVIDKQPGVVVHPTKGHKAHTIANGLMKHMQEKDEQYKIRFVNRLDMDTSGLLLIGKNSHCQDDFTNQAKAKKVTKCYLAVVKGLLKEEEGVIELPIGKQGEDSPRRAVAADGAPSVTRYKVIHRYEKGYSLVRLTLETGRTHQIRVHMEHIGHPVVGDALYSSSAEEEKELIGRQALHACHLAFYHPAGGERLELDAPLPEDMEKLLTLLGKTI